MTRCRPVGSFLAALIVASLALATPGLAITAQEKMATCKFGADDQKLAGAKRKSFLSKCMADTDAPAKAASPQKKK